MCKIKKKFTEGKARKTIDVQYRQSESDGQIHQTSFTMDPMEFFFKIHSHVTNILIHYVINANIITM